ncbi:MAG: allophanate hydrolase [Pseudomonadota bacterium]
MSLSFDFAALHAAYAAGRRPEETVAEVYARIKAVGDPGIFIHLRDEAEVTAEAKALGAFDPEKPLWGLPFAIKDNIDLAGVPTTAACPAYAYTPARDATVVSELRAAGALAIGKTNLDQFAAGLVGVRSPYPIPKNSLDPAIVPGGSSAGSAVAVGHGIVSFALGTDTAGSGRVPAALNNIVGLKPTLGALSATGVVPACRTLDTISIFALTVADAYAAFQVAARYDQTDAFARAIAASPLVVPPPLSIGIPNADTIAFFGDAAQAGSFDAALGTLRSIGHQIIPLDFTPFFDVAEMLYGGAWVAERMTVIEELLRKDPEAVHPVTCEVVSAADALSAADAFRAIHRLADLKRVAEPFLNAVDLLAVPTIPTFYSVADLEADPITPNSNLGTYTNFVNLMDLCGIAVPTGMRSDGRPGSLTLLAKDGRDALCASLATEIHSTMAQTMGATGCALPERQVLEPGPVPGEITLAVVGAHMSGLPLNKELTERGARYLETTETAPDYRLYALAGGPPARPGLVRVGEGGRAIVLELWAMPETALGSFFEGIPAPLGLGSIALSDGRVVKGFLAEAEGVTDADDISAFGGWRAYLSSL